MRWAAVFASIVSAELLAAAHTWPACSPLILFALVPLIRQLDPRAWRESAFLLGLCFFVFALQVLAWIALSGPGQWMLVPIAALLGAAFFVLPALACAWLARRDGPRIGLFALPASWAAIELLGDHLLAVPWWPYLGEPLVDLPLLGQAAALGGPAGLTFVAAASSVSIAVLLGPPGRAIRAAAVIHGPVLVAAAAMWGWTWQSLPRAATVSCRVAAIQPDVPQGTKWSEESRRETLRLFDRLLDEAAASRPDVIVLPETALAGFVRFEDDLTEWVKESVRRTRCALLFGSLDRSEDGTRWYNVAILVTPGGRVETYRKSRLAPVTESIPDFGPLDFLLRPAIVALRGDSRTLTAGTEPGLFHLDDGTAIAPLICLEDADARAMAEAARARAGLVVSLINTERFRSSSLPMQHLRRSRLASIAAGMPAVRCANSGITCSIDANGRVVERLGSSADPDARRPSAGVFRVEAGSRRTAYSIWGDAGTAIWILLFLLLARRVARN